MPWCSPNRWAAATCAPRSSAAYSDDASVTRVVEVMASLNRAAAEAMQEVGVHAATDVTGFGVLGHALGMAEASGTTLRIRAAEVPCIEGLEAYATADNTCGGLKRNLAYAQGKATFSGGTDLQQRVLADPQTSGGLLISLPADRVDALLAALAARDVACRAVVGEVIARAATAVEVC